MHLDNRTVVVVSIFITLILGLLTALVWRTRKTYPGFGRWTIGNLLVPLGLVLLSLRGILPDWVTIVLANTSSILAAILFLEGTREFRGMRPRLASAYFGGGFTTLALIYFRYAVDDINARIVTISLVLGIYSLCCAATLLKDMPAGCKPSMAFTGTVFAVVGAADLIRAIYFLNHPPLAELFAPSLLNAVFFLNLGAASIAWSFGFLLLTNDRLVMDLKDAEAQTASVNRELGDAIQHANRMAERAAEADAAKSDFLAHMSHEIRTPLNGVIGMTNLVLDGALAEDKRPDLIIVQESAQSLLAIINDILDLSKIEAGQMTVRIAPFDLRRVLQQVVELFEPQAIAKATRLSLIYPDEAHRWFSGDENRVRQIVSNYTANAVKFTDGGDIKVGMEQLGSVVRLSVRDTGIGIDQAMLPRLFTKFTQVNAPSQNSTGTGLGLAISKSFAELMAGSVGVVSEKGRGSTFWVELPLARVAEPKLHAHSVSSEFGYDLKSVRLLVAEDNAVNQRLLVRLLEKQGCAVDVVSSGAEALHRCCRTKYDLILMDCHMPVMDGYEATRQIRMREKENGAYTPIIAITANAMSGELDRCREAGMDDYLSKPINSAVLFECIALNRSKAIGWAAGVPSDAVNSETQVTDAPVLF